MGDFKMGSKTVLSQSGTAKPTFGSGVPTGTVLRTIHRKFGHYDNDAGSVAVDAIVPLNGAL